MPFFGVPIRNGLPIGLGSVAGFGVQQFDPSQLFEGGTVAGAWYDPSDLSTMFTTDAGTTPVAMPGGGSAVVVGRMLDKSGNGNHAIAFNNTTARPELRARVNLLTYSEEFDNGAWTKTNTTITANAAVAPDGTLTADALIDNSTNADHKVRQGIAVTSGAAYTLSVVAKVNTLNYIWLYASTPNIGTFFDLAAGTVLGNIGGAPTSSTISALGDGWYRCSITYTANATSTQNHDIGTSPNGTSFNYIGSGQSIYIWGADLRPANIGANVPAYQRIADANTYDTSGFPLYLRFDGIDDSMYTPANLNLSGTDKVSVFAGVRKLSDAAFSVVSELSAVATSNNGSFLVAAPNAAGPRFAFYSRGTLTVAAEINNAVYAAPISNVFTGLGDISGDSALLRLNGVQVGSNTSDQGTGNFGTYPLFIGARNNASAWFNGHLHSLIIAGSAVSAGNISATEQWVAGKTGIQI